MLLTIILLIYFIPIIIFWMIVYHDMKKGQSVEEFFIEEGCEDFIWLIMIPIFNIIIIASEFWTRILDKIKKFRK